MGTRCRLATVAVGAAFCVVAACSSSEAPQTVRPEPGSAGSFAAHESAPAPEPMALPMEALSVEADGYGLGVVDSPRQSAVSRSKASGRSILMRKRPCRGKAHQQERRGAS